MSEESRVELLAAKKTESPTSAQTTETFNKQNENVPKPPSEDVAQNANITLETAKKQKESIPRPPTEDPGSELFDPLHVLYAENVRISQKPPPIQFQNLAAFDSALKRNGIWGLQQKTNKTGTAMASTSKKVTVETPQTTRRFLPHQMPIKAAAGTTGIKQRHTKNLLKWLEKVEGPLKLLAVAMAAKTQIRVVVRNERGVRGFMEGTILSFDRHWNLLLKDVKEVWCRRKFKYAVNKSCEADNPSQDCSAVLEELGIKLPSQTVKSLNRKNVEITRQLEQLFIKGEQVVLVNILSKNK